MDKEKQHTIFSQPVFRHVGERGLLIEFSAEIDLETNQKIHAFCRLLEDDLPEGIVEIIPSYRSLVLVYEPLVVDMPKLQEKLVILYGDVESATDLNAEIVEIPVCYGGEFGEDLEYVATHNGLSVDQVISIHSGTVYPVYMIGFTPGFPYLGGLSEKLHTPRLATPRTLVPAGSVGIANNQTGIYPIDSPGGWQLIGRCPYKLFDPLRSNPFLVKAGDQLRFIPVSRQDFFALQTETT
ncbi:5-oxoprolinase subunit PxpB [Desulfogranum marinum]|uniref:5-oxoprolinase subunit PxpB n=1 Tax=Desulfogranum marinum TaxID=453220 RepID=UPI0029C690EF|nr:5-oxoprolinase subunit PxpB [Desulfogranum marinum]